MRPVVPCPTTPMPVSLHVPCPPEAPRPTFHGSPCPLMSPCPHPHPHVPIPMSHVPVPISPCQHVPCPHPCAHVPTPTHPMSPSPHPMSPSSPVPRPHAHSPCPQVLRVPPTPIPSPSPSSPLTRERLPGLPSPLLPLSPAILVPVGHLLALHCRWALTHGAPPSPCPQGQPQQRTALGDRPLRQRLHAGLAPTRQPPQQPEIFRPPPCPATVPVLVFGWGAAGTAKGCQTHQALQGGPPAVAALGVGGEGVAILLLLLGCLL